MMFKFFYGESAVNNNEGAGNNSYLLILFIIDKYFILYTITYKII